MNLRNQISAYRNSTGATLIEVLVAVAVTSVGLLGMAGLMAVSARVNLGAYQRAQTEFVAHSLIESMHLNAAQVAQGRYDGSYSGDLVAKADCRKQGCSATELADYDKFRFDHTLAATLPNPQASLKCAGDSAVIAAGTTAYNGLCRLEIAWSERSLSQGSDATPQALVWVFQP